MNDSIYRRAGVSAIVAGLVALGGTAVAQDQPQPSAQEVRKTQQLEEIVVTGSRVRRDEFSTASPIQIITREGSVLAGLSGTTELLQSSATTTGGGQQINNSYGGFVVDGGPGVNTLSLRGLGAVRTLVLLNGRRLGPAGTRGSVSAADLNVLPSALVERIEVLKDGASSIYGSDAVAGVVNIITRKGIDDTTFEIQGFAPVHDGGEQYGASVVAGVTRDRWELSGSFEYFAREEMTWGDRDWSSCSQDYFFNPETGARLDPNRFPGAAAPKCFPVGGSAGTNGVAHSYIRAFMSPTASLQNSFTPDATAAGAAFNGWRDVTPNALRPDFDPRLLKQSLISPTKNYNGFLMGSYDLESLGNAELYGELLVTRRESHQTGVKQLFLDYPVFSPLIPEPFRSDIWYVVGRYPLTGKLPAGSGLANNPACLSGNTAATAGCLVGARAFMFWGTDRSEQSVDFTRAVVGLKGDLPFGNWQYDGNVILNRADAEYTFESFLNDRVYYSLDIVPTPAGSSAPSRLVNGVNVTCRINVTSPGKGCIPTPPITASLVTGTIDQAYRDYINQTITGRTKYDETTVTLNTNGDLFAMPFGMARGALGLEYRKMKLNDVPDPEMQAGNLYNFTSAGITKGDDNVKEVYAEIELPLLRNVAFAKDLTFNVSGRYTDYDSYGSDETYKVGLNYAPANWLKLRGTKGTSFRAPALFESNLSATSGFLDSSFDPCNEYGSKNPNSVLYKNCQQEIGDPTYIARNGVQVNTVGGKDAGLKSEQSDAETIGLVFQPTLPARYGDFSFAVDWWKIEVNDQIDRLGGNVILSLCYNDPQFRAGGSYCSFVDPRVTGASLVVKDSYINVATQIVSGWDFNTRYSIELGTGRFTGDFRATRYIRQDNKTLPTDPLDRLNGTLFAPKWVGDIDLRYEWKEWTFRYGLEYYGKMDSYDFYEEDPAQSVYALATDAYTEQAVSVRYRNTKSKWDITAGVRNLTDAKPREFSSGVTNLRRGNALMYSGYDFYGRAFFVNIAKTL